MQMPNVAKVCDFPTLTAPPPPSPQRWVRCADCTKMWVQRINGMATYSLGQDCAMGVISAVLGDLEGNAPNRLLKKDFEPAHWRKVFRFRRKTARNPRSMCRFWTDFPVYRNWSRRFSTFQQPLRG